MANNVSHCSTYGNNTQLALACYYESANYQKNEYLCDLLEEKGYYNSMCRFLYVKMRHIQDVEGGYEVCDRIKEDDLRTYCRAMLSKDK